MAALNSPAPLDLRVNTIKADRDDVLAALERDGLPATAMPYSPLGLRLQGKPALQKHPRFLDGSFEVQDEGSQLLGQLLAPRRGEMVCDFCAGAGGKTLLLGAMMHSTGRLYAFDVSEKRLAKLKPRLARSGLSNVQGLLIAHERDTKVKRLAGKFDRVLVDAPCSGLGTLRRNPDLKWRQTPESVAELTAKQAAILAAAASLVKTGGRLVYATCSLLTEENEDHRRGLPGRHGDFRLLPVGELLAAQKIPLEMGQYLRWTRRGTAPTASSPPCWNGWHEPGASSLLASLLFAGFSARADEPLLLVPGAPPRWPSRRATMPAPWWWMPSARPGSRSWCRPTASPTRTSPRPWSMPGGAASTCR
jgi:16S rRNA (cytosine967-C5)-methyltransferase